MQAPQILPNPSKSEAGLVTSSRRTCAHAARGGTDGKGDEG